MAAARSDVPAPRERARAEPAAPSPAAPSRGFWLHNGMLLVERREDVEEPRQLPHLARRAGARAGRGDAAGCCCAAHYRAALDFAEAALAEARQELDRFYRALERLPGWRRRAVPEPVLEALCDDLNTPLASSRCTRWPTRRSRAMPRRPSGCARPAALLGLLRAGAGGVVPRRRGRGRDRGGDRGTAGGAQRARLRPGRRDPRELAARGHRAGGRAARHHLAARDTEGDANDEADVTGRAAARRGARLAHDPASRRPSPTMPGMPNAARASRRRHRPIGVRGRDGEDARDDEGADTPATPTPISSPA